VTHRPVPVPDASSALFWEATAAGRLALARCSRCHRFTHPPGPVCPHCRSTDPDFSFEAVPGSGTVASWTVLRQAFLPGFAQDVPLVLVDVLLDETHDVRLIGRLLDGVDAPLAIGDQVRLAFEHLADGISVPAFMLEPT